MIGFVNNQWPILQVILPLFSALLVAIIPKITLARIVTKITILCATILNIYGLINLNGEQRYNLGGFTAPIGIEYRLDDLNQPILCFISLVTLFTLITLQSQIKLQVEEYISASRRHLLYSLILLVHSGMSGLVSTNDLFNLYVFLEISSLASYALISQGSDKRCLVGALDYLLMGTVGASLILLGIGMLFTTTGSLNIDDIHLRLENLYDSKVVILGLVLFITGGLLKIALFPLHFWMIRAYSFTAPVLLVFLAGISSVVGFYILLRFIYFVIDYKILYNSFFGEFIKNLSLFSIVIASYLALKARDIRGIIVYSSAAQIAYATIMLTKPSSLMVAIAISTIIADSIIKIALFIIQSPGLNTQQKSNKLTRANILFYILVAFTILANSSMPPTVNFINKINMLSALLNASEYLAFGVIIATSILALEYNYRMFKILYSNHLKAGYKEVISLLIPILISLMLLINNEKFLQFIQTFLNKGVTNG